jgi:phenylalanyl-tRNA synthetase beta chain
MVTLDDVERKLKASDLLICDAAAPVALAGVMGGQTSEVSDSTSSILLESANFDAMTIRRTAKRLGLHSDASHRFERAVDPNIASFACQRAALLLAQVGGGKVVEGEVDCYPKTIEAQRVTMRLSRCAALSGIHVAKEIVMETLTRQGLEAKESGSDELSVLVPTSRADIRREVDLIEEVVRIYGFDRVPATLPDTTVRPTSVADQRRVRGQRAMISAGFCESLSYGFTSPKRIADLGFPAEDRRSQPIAIDNPMTVEQSVMRTSLWSNLLSAVAHNRKREVRDVRLFELGHVFLQTPEATALPDEPLELCALLAGHTEGWLRPGAEVDFYDAKGAVEGVLAAIYGDTSDFEFRPSPRATPLHPGISAGIFNKNGVEIGCVGEVHPHVRKAFDLDSKVFGFELKLGAMAAPKDTQMVGIPRYPAVTRDISMFLSLDVPASQVRAIIDDSKEDLIAQVHVLEDYRDPAHVPEGQKGMLWSVTYRSLERTLTDGEVDEVHQRLEKQLLSDLSATRR